MSKRKEKTIYVGVRRKIYCRKEKKQVNSRK
jgi:hypothetical protein